MTQKYWAKNREMLNKKRMEKYYKSSHEYETRAALINTRRKFINNFDKSIQKLIDKKKRYEIELQELLSERLVNKK